MKRAITLENGAYEIITPSKIKIIHPLSCGNNLVIWFERSRVRATRGSLWEGIKECWNVSIYVGELKDANKWKHKAHARVTGNGSLEALKKAKDYILSFAEGWINYGCELQVAGLDDKRYRAYKFLCRYDGFIKNDEYKIIHYRNPKFYEWSED